MQLRSLITILALTASCAETSESDPPRETHLHSAEPAEPLGLCGGGACREGFGALEFVNGSGAFRNVYVNGEHVCALLTGERCEIEVEAAERALIHVTDEGDAETCSDPSATLGACVCARFEIAC
jgi:hypothetical protein